MSLAPARMFMTPLLLTLVSAVIKIDSFVGGELPPKAFNRVNAKVDPRRFQAVK